MLVQMGIFPKVNVFSDVFVIQDGDLTWAPTKMWINSLMENPFEKPWDQ